MTVIFSQLAPGGVPSSQSCAPLGYWCEWVSRVEDSSFSVLFESWSGRRVKTSKSKKKKNIKNFAWILLRGWIYIYIWVPVLKETAWLDRTENAFFLNSTWIIPVIRSAAEWADHTDEAFLSSAWMVCVSALCVMCGLTARTSRSQTRRGFICVSICGVSRLTVQRKN